MWNKLTPKQLSTFFISVNTSHLPFLTKTPLILLFHWSIFGRSQQSINLLCRDFLIVKEIITSDPVAWKLLILIHKLYAWCENCGVLDYVNDKDGLRGLHLCIWLKFHRADGKWSIRALEILSSHWCNECKIYEVALVK